MQIEGNPVERFYHFICRSDDHLMRLIDELGLRKKLFWHQTRTSFFHDGRYYPFGTPPRLAALLRRPADAARSFRAARAGVSLQEAVAMARSDAGQAVADRMDREGSVRRHLAPLLKVKFGDDHDKISAAWIWHRIWRVAASRNSLFERESFGCLEHGTATIVEALVQKLKALPNVDLYTDSPVKPLIVQDGKVSRVQFGDKTVECDAVISTVALPALDRLVPGQTDPYFERARSIKYIGVVCMMLSLDRPFGKYFWTNINDQRISFNGIVEQSALNQNLRNKASTFCTSRSICLPAKRATRRRTKSCSPSTRRCCGY